MFKVILVDDEPWTLEGLKKACSWEKLGFEVIGTTTRPSKALEMIEKKEPDVVFVDIRMPKITGIELMEKTRKKGMNTEFIIISGYAKFSYAQEAIRLGAFDYCLKPVKTAETNNILKRLSNYLRKQKEQSGKGRNKTGFAKYKEIDNEQFVKLLKYIQKNFQKKLYLKNLAQKFGLHPNYCCRLFSSYLDTSFSEYLTNIRIKEAKKLLMDREISIEEVGLQVGYPDYYYFNKVFKKNIGVTPSKYRKEHLLT